MVDNSAFFAGDSGLHLVDVIEKDSSVYDTNNSWLTCDRQVDLGSSLGDNLFRDSFIADG